MHETSRIRLGRRFAVVIALVAGLAGATPADAAKLSDGSLDPHFGLGGGLIEWRNGGIGNVSAVQPDGKILLGTDTGSFYRYTVGGTADASFGDDGAIEVGTSSNAETTGIAVQPDGKIVVVGRLGSGGADQVARYLPDGTLDTTFGDSGMRTLPVGIYGNSPTDVAIQSDGKILIVGDASDADWDWYAVRLRPNGGLDPTFDPGGPTPGVLVVNFVATEGVNAVTVQPDGKILIAGYANTGSDNDMSLFRLLPTGAFDDAFGDFGGGAEFTAVGTGDDAAYDVAVAPDGHIYVAGDATWANVDAVLVRYTSAGKIDTAWGESGHRAYNPLGYEHGGSVAVQRNGKVLLAGTSYSSNSTFDTRVLLVRVNRDGTDDASFGSPRLYFYGNNYGSGGAGLTVMRNGRIVVGGDAQIQGSLQPAVMRVLGDTVRPSAATVSIGSRLASGRRWISWRATDDNTGVRSYRVQYRSRRLSATAFGSWHTWRSATTVHKARFSPTTGRRYCFRARATDWAGNIGAFGTSRCFNS